MDKDVLTNMLNRLEDKLDKVSTGLTANTTITSTHTQMLADMKGVHDVNAKIILETRDEMKSLNNTVVNIVSWKKGQIEAMAKNISDIKTLHDRLLPIEQDYNERKDKKKDTEQKVVGFAWKAMEKVLFAIIGAILISWQTILNNLKNFL